MEENRQPQYTVTYHSAADVRPTPQEGVLEEKFLHRLFVLSHTPATWSPWRLLLGLLSAATAVWMMWRHLGKRLAWRMATLYQIFALFDWVLLWWLPRSKYSFGPIGPQLFSMTVPRIGAAWLSAMLGKLNPNLGKFSFMALQTFGTVTYLWGLLFEPFALSTTRQSLKSQKLSHKPLRLLHLSDLHIERLTERENHLLKQVNEIAPDIIVITGDYTNLSYVNDPTAQADIRTLLSQLHAPYGVYATLGSPPADPRSTTPSLFTGLDNIRLLRDEVAVLTLPDGSKISLMGLDCEHDQEADWLVCQHLLELSDPDSMRVLLYHSPELMPQVQQLPIDLYLCGHTHGGQVRMPFYGALTTSTVTGKQYEMGPYTEQGTTMYISRGIGLEGLSAPRLRLLCPPEIILWTLQGEQTSS